jgi:DNA-binding transcriptional regulator YhcF (GntR family)
MASIVMSKKLQLGAGRKKDASLILGCFRGVTALQPYWNKWIVSDVWLEIINSTYDIPDELKFTTKQLIASVARNKLYKSNNIESIKVVNPMGLYKAWYKTKKDGQQNTIVAYYATQPNTLPTVPGGNTKWYHDMVSLVPGSLEKEQTTANKKSLPEEGSMPTTASVPTKKRRRGEVFLRHGATGHFVAPNDPERAMKQARFSRQQETPLEGRTATESTASEPPSVISWWDSCNAFSLFGEQVDKNNEDANDDEDAWDVKAMVRKRIERLRRGHTTVGGWRLTIDDLDTRGICSEHDIFNIQMKCKYLSVALGIALDDMPSRTWRQCCNEAVQRVNKWETHEHIKNGETLRIWHHDFRGSNECFRNPNVYKRNGKPPLPPMLERNPDFTRSVVRYAKTNLKELSAELLFNYLHEIALPALLLQRREELGDEAYETTDLLRENRLTKLTLETVYRWLDRLGFKYEARKKGYYVDNHEKPETVAYRRHFIKRYLKYEFRMFRWIQLSLEKVKAMEENEEIDEGLGHRYQNSENKDMVEFHVDQHPSFQDEVSTTLYGGNLSVRIPLNAKPLICFGQDECIFKQFTFTPKAWCAPDGQRPMTPKDEGLGVMISAFVSREFGFGYSLTLEDLAKVNEKRLGQKYSDEDAAKKIRGNSSNKIGLTESPFVVEFEYGAHNQGYWDYDHMIIQFEDCIDVVKTLHPEFDFVFLFDHSCGHDRQRADGLSVPNINKTHGGAQPKMRKSKMETDEFLGPFPATLSVGDYQHMVYQDGDVGPFFKTDAERQASKFDTLTGTTRRAIRRKDAMEKDLIAKGVRAKGNKVAIVELCKQNDVPYKVTTETINEGWNGKAKGMLQILWERGFIDPAIEPTKAEGFYTNDGKKDAFGNLIPGTSLRKMMSSLIDFINEETLLQYHGKTLGVLVDRSPKCHPEVAGEGIEYSWGCAKGKYRRLPISDKRKKENFRQSVRECLDRTFVLTIERQRMFSKRARQYMLAYHSIELSKEKRELVGAVGSNDDEKLEMSAYLVEKIIKRYKSHRGATDFDSAYIDAIVNDMKKSGVSVL